MAVTGQTVKTDASDTRSCERCGMAIDLGEFVQDSDNNLVLGVQIRHAYCPKRRR